MNSVNLFVDYNKKYKCSEITDRIAGTSNCVICAICRCPMFPKRILFRTIRNNGTVVFNFIGKGGHGCFIQQNGVIICKKCFDYVTTSDDLEIEQNINKHEIELIENIELDIDENTIYDISEDEMFDIIDTSIRTTTDSLITF